MTDLAAFLLARLAEDEAAARAATPGPWTTNGLAVWRTPNDSWDHHSQLVGKPPRLPFVMLSPHETSETGNADHIARHDPARVLAEVAAKRALLAELAMANMVFAMRLMAEPYDDHPDFNPAWKVKP